MVLRLVFANERDMWKALRGYLWNPDWNPKIGVLWGTNVTNLGLNGHESRSEKVRYNPDKFQIDVQIDGKALPTDCSFSFDGLTDWSKINTAVEISSLRKAAVGL